MFNKKFKITPEIPAFSKPDANRLFLFQEMLMKLCQNDKLNYVQTPVYMC